MNDERIIEHTDDGSATLFVPTLNEHYHSTKGAWTESQHIFIDMGLRASSLPDIHILEVGFGTGLNAWLTLKEAERSGRRVHYTGVERHPLSWETVRPLGYAAGNDDEMLFKRMHTCPWEEPVELTPHFVLHKRHTDVLRYAAAERRPDERPNLIYFDAFAPEKQPEMWSQELFDDLYVLLSNEGLLTTYCAKGVVRRMLQSAGFTVERLPGPPGGKREMLRARKNPLNINPDDEILKNRENTE